MAVANPDFSAYVQRAKDLNPQGIYVFIPGGAQPGAFGKALAERGIDPKKTKVMGQKEIADEHALASMGDSALGIITAATTTTISSPSRTRILSTPTKRNSSAIRTSSRSAAMTACP